MSHNLLPELGDPTATWIGYLNSILVGAWASGVQPAAQAAMDAAQHKIVNLLKTFSLLVSFRQCLCI